MLPFSRFEAKTILKLSGPIVLAQLTQTMMYVIDTLMAGRVGALDMAAIAVASAIWLPIILTFQGLLLALTPIIAQHFGARQHQAIPATTLQGAYLAGFLATLLMIAMQFIGAPLSYLQMEDEVRQKAVDYLHYVSFGIYPLAGYMVLRNLFEGIGNTKATMWIAFVGLLVNIPANYVFIYGHLGMPALGGAGCGLATALVHCAMFCAMLTYALRSRSSKRYMVRPPSLQPCKKELWQIIAIGTPIAFSLFFEVTLFSCIPLLIVHLGAIVVSGHQIANNYSALVFMLPMSMGLATTIRVGHLVGSRDVKELKKAVSTAVQLAMLMAVGIATLTFVARFFVASLYSTDPAVIHIAASILVLACFYQLSDAVQVVCACALRGLKYTKPVFYITFVAYWPIGFGLGTLLGLTDILVPKMGAHGFWIGIIIGLTVAAVLLALILKRRLKVLENDTMALAATDTAGQPIQLH
ncbi:MATE family efflux transporter [Rheinheimera sp.]|uniref:MATE family efflux transporter n=1 Tax=Rheinheimera sp. TaxID=1869214 RepID=UPI00307F9C18